MAPHPRFPGNAERRDPLRNFNFQILIDGDPVAACRKMSGLTASVEVVKFRAGDSPSSTDELSPGRTSFEPITLESGLTNSDQFKNWAQALVHHSRSTWERQGSPDFRRNIEIHVFDIDAQQAVKKFAVHDAWVSKFTALSELSADANDVLIETLEIQHEGFTEI